MRHQINRPLTHPRQPYLIHFAVGLLLGIGLDIYFSNDMLSLLFVLAYLIGVFSAISLLFNVRTIRAWFLIGISLGALRAAYFDDSARYEDEISGQLGIWPSSVEAELEGCVARGSRPTRRGQTLLLEVSRWRHSSDLWFSASGFVQVWWEGELRNVMGECLRVTGELRRTAPRTHPYEQGGRREDVRAVFFAEHSDRLVGFDRQAGWPHSLLGELERVRIEREEALRPLVSQRVYGWFLALGSGSRSLLNAHDRETMIMAGIAHLLAISGLHLFFVIVSARLFFEWIISRFSWPLLWLPLRSYGATLTFIVSWGFAFFTGLSTSVIRAALYFSYFCFAQLFYQKGSHVGALAFAVAFSAFYDPSQVMGPSLQLSAFGVLGLLAAGALRRSTREPQKEGAGRFLPAGVLRLICASFGAAMATYPLTAYHFGVISISGLITNVVVAPVMAPLLVFSSLIALFCAEGAPQVSVFLGQIVEVGLEHALAVLGFAAQTMQDCWVTGRPSVPEILGWYVGCFLVWIGLLRPAWRRSAWRISLVVCIVTVALAGALRLSPPSNLEVYFLPVGQGDATFVRFPSGTTLLVDAGGYMGNELAAERVIIPFLRGLGVRRVDWLLLTHGDRDHRAGLEAVSEEFSPSLFWWNGEVQSSLENSPDDELTQMILSRAETVDRGTPTVDVGSALVSVLHPPQTSHQYLPQLTENDNSVVLSILFEGRTVLLMGDTEKQSESILLAQSLSRDIDVLKAGHHGSRTSSQPALLAHLFPRFGVFSAGPENRFGFPHPDVVEAFRGLGIQTCNTAENGLISAIVSEDGVEIECFRD